ncbi:hypothetical protein DFS34DRAFT_32062 [Phlyctochytrium arcticum]|nr:hypothetical protein DFS34DRAFT_32062 [Phlyctochytrium arcticum]
MPTDVDYHTGGGSGYGSAKDRHSGGPRGMFGRSGEGASRTPSTRPSLSMSGQGSNQLATQPGMSTVFQGSSDLSPSQTEQGLPHLRVLSAMQALQDGKLPTNEQLEGLIYRMMHAEGVRRREYLLSEEGAQTWTDFKKLMRGVQDMLDRKNPDELLQRFIWHARLATKSQLKTAGAESAFREVASKESSDQLSEIARLLVLDTEFRKLVLALNQIFQKAVEGIGSSASGSQRDSGSGYQKGDLGEKGEEMEREQSFESSQAVQGYRLGGGEGKRPQELERDEGAPSLPPRGREDTLRREEKAETPPSTKDHSRRDSGRTPTSAAKTEPQPYEQPPSVEGSGMGMDMEEEMEQKETPQREKGKKNRLSSSTFGRGKLGDPISEEKSRELARRHAGRIITDDEGNTYLAAREFKDTMSEDDAEKIGKALQSVMLAAAFDERYKNALLYLMGLFGKAHKMTAEAAAGMDEGFPDANLIVAQKSLKMLVERFSGEARLDDLLDSISTFTDQLAGDFTLRNLVYAISTFLKSSLEDEDFLLDSDYAYRAADLVRRTRETLAVNHVENTERLASAAAEFTDALTRDEVTNCLSYDVNKLANDVSKDKDGNCTLKPGLIGDFATVVLPAIMEQIKTVTIPRIEHEDARFHIVVEDIVLESESFLPSDLELEIRNRALVALKGRRKSNKLVTEFTVVLHRIQAKVEDIPFYYHKKSGFPRLKDAGVADIELAGQGLTIAPSFILDLNSRTHTLLIKDVGVLIDQIKLSLHDTHHHSLYSVLSPMINNLIREKLAQTINTQIREWTSIIDEQLTHYKLKFLDQAEGTQNRRLEQMMPGRGRGQMEPKEEQQQRGAINMLLDVVGLGRQERPAIIIAKQTPLGVGDVDDFLKAVPKRKAAARRPRQPWLSDAFNPEETVV